MINKVRLVAFGSGSSFLIGLLISTLGSVLLALIVWIIIRNKVKSGWYWFGAFFGIIVMFIILLSFFGINLITTLQQLLPQ